MKKSFINILIIVFLLFCTIKYVDIVILHNGFVAEEKNYIIIEKQEPVQYTFYYQQLNAQEKQIYESMLYAATNYINYFYIGSNLNDEEIYKSICAFYNDYPEFFWCDNVMVKTKNKDCFLKYNISEDDKKDVEKIKEEAEKIIDKIPKNYNEYERALFLYEYIITNTIYTEKSENNQDLRSVLFNKKSVCGGYSKAYQYLCNLAGIKCTTVSGVVYDKEKDKKENHAWNLIELDNNYYWVDTTWGDSYEAKTDSIINYDFFFCDDSFLKDHEIVDLYNFNKELNKNFFNYPKCSDDSKEYFKYMGYYIEEYNFDDVKNIFDEFLSEDLYSCVIIKCSNKQVFDELINELFEEKNIHRILTDYDFGNDSISYTYTRDENSYILFFNIDK